MADPPAEHLSIGRLFSRTAEVLRRGGWRVMGLAVVVFVATRLIDDVVGRLLAQPIAAHQPLSLAPWLAQFGPFVVGDTAVVCAALSLLSGQPVSLRRCLAAAVRLLPVMLIIDLVENVPDALQQLVPDTAIIAWLDRTIGVSETAPAAFPVALAVALATVAVAVIWESFWAPAMAVAVDEGGRADRALGRGLALTQGNRAAVVAFNLALNLGGVIVPLILVAPLRASGISFGVNWLEVVLAAPFFAFGSAGQAVIYRELVRLKEGVGPAEVAGVFD